MPTTAPGRAPTALRTSFPAAARAGAATVQRYVEAFRELLARPEPTILVVAHSLPIRYALDAAAGSPPRPAVEQIPYAEPFELDAPELSRAAEVLERWCSAPAWPRTT